MIFLVNSTPCTILNLWILINILEVFYIQCLSLTVSEICILWFIAKINLKKKINCLQKFDTRHSKTKFYCRMWITKKINVNEGESQKCLLTLFNILGVTNLIARVIPLLKSVRLSEFCIFFLTWDLWWCQIRGPYFPFHQSSHPRSPYFKILFIWLRYWRASFGNGGVLHLAEKYSVELLVW